MSDTPRPRQIEFLHQIATAGGFVETVDDVALAETCVDEGWLTHEGETGYALTLEGSSLLRATPS